jgi:hypothetical protein
MSPTNDYPAHERYELPFPQMAAQRYEQLVTRTMLNQAIAPDLFIKPARIYSVDGPRQPQKLLVLVRFFDGPWARRLHLLLVDECEVMPNISVYRDDCLQLRGHYAYAYKTQHRWTVEYTWQPEPERLSYVYASATASGLNFLPPGFSF